MGRAIAKHSLINTGCEQYLGGRSSVMCNGNSKNIKYIYFLVALIFDKSIQCNVSGCLLKNKSIFYKILSFDVFSIRMKVELLLMFQKLKRVVILFINFYFLYKWQLLEHRKVCLIFL